MKKIQGMMAILFAIWTLTVYAAAESQQEINKRNTIAFCKALMNEKNFASARQFIGDHYIQHDPYVEDGIEGLRKSFELLQMIYPNMHIEIKRAAADGDYVYLHIHAVMVPNTKGNALVDIFRFDKGKIVEHWDAIQEIPFIAMNNNTMF